MGSDLDRLDGVAQVQQMTAAEQARYQQAMLQKYRSLPPAEQQAWRNDKVVGMVLGNNWWRAYKKSCVS
jgi:hypothetical protein